MYTHTTESMHSLAWRDVRPGTWSGGWRRTGGRSARGCACERQAQHFADVFTCVCMYVYIYICVYEQYHHNVYIYIYIEREIHIHTYVYTLIILSCNTDNNNSNDHMPLHCLLVDSPSGRIQRSEIVRTQACGFQNIPTPAYANILRCLCVLDACMRVCLHVWMYAFINHETSIL